MQTLCNTELAARAMQVGKKSSTREVVDEALAEYIERRELGLRQARILELAGTIEYAPGEDPVSRRQREREQAKLRAAE